MTEPPTQRPQAPQPTPPTPTVQAPTSPVPTVSTPGRHLALAGEPPGPAAPGPAAPAEPAATAAWTGAVPAQLPPSVTTTVTCPRCGEVAAVELSRRDAKDFCRRCDFPLFWAIDDTLFRDQVGAVEGSLRRLPGTLGRQALAAVICPNCAEPNSPLASHCVRCGYDFHPAPPPPPEPEPEPLPPPPPPVVVPRPSYWWVWLIVAAVVVAAAVTIVLLHNYGALG